MEIERRFVTEEALEFLEPRDIERSGDQVVPCEVADDEEQDE